MPFLFFHLKYWEWARLLGFQAQSALSDLQHFPLAHSRGHYIYSSLTEACALLAWPTHISHKENSPNPGDVSDFLIQTSGHVSTGVWQKWRVRNQPHIFLSQIQFSKIQINIEFSYYRFHKISQITDRILNSRWNTAVKFKDWNTLIVKTIVLPGTKTRIKGERH